MANTNGFIKMAVGALVVIIVAAGVILPLFASAEITAGKETTVNNTMISTTPKYTIWDGGDIEFTYDSSTSTYEIDGEAYTYYSAAQRIILASNDFAYRNGGSEQTPQLRSEYIGDTADANSSFTFSIVDGEYTLTIGEDEHTGTVDWLVYASADGAANLGAIPANGAFVTSTSNDIVVLGNIYATGDNDTFYAYFGGDLSVNSTYADNSSVTIGKTLKDGYTDIYDTTVTVNIGDESFTPYYILAPLTVDGHEKSGITYTIVTMLPVLIIAGVLVMIAGAFISNRRA